MKHKVEWGIIGLGNIAFEFAKSFQYSKNANLLAVASNSDEKLNFFKEKFNIKTPNLYNDYEKLLENENIDIVYIALPNSLHFEWILKALEKNKNILIEKPAFINPKDAEIILNHPNFKNILFSEGYMYRYHPQIIELIQIIKSNMIGKLISMKSNFGINLIYKKKFFIFKREKLDKNLRIFNKKLGGGVIFDLGCYTTSMSLMIASLIDYIDVKNFKFSEVNTKYLHSDIDVQSSAKINFDNKFISDIEVSFTNNLGNKTVITGDEGEVSLKSSWGTENSKITISGKVNNEIEFKDCKKIYSLEIDHVSKDILTKNKETSFPGASQKEILLNTIILENWINGQK